MACSYRGEHIGLMAIHLILLAKNEVNPGLCGLVHIYSDCLGALDKVKNLPPSRVPLGLSHSDVLKNILVNCSSLSFARFYSHVKAHQDDTVKYKDLTRPAQLNVNTDSYAKQALWDLQATRPPTQQAFPLGPVCVFADSAKITADTGQAARFGAHHRQARERFISRTFYTLLSLIKWIGRWCTKPYMKYHDCFSNGHVSRLWASRARWNGTRPR